MDNKKNKMRRISLDDYIWSCFVKFLNKENNHVQRVGGKSLSEDVNYNFAHAENRNKKQVTDKLWRSILIRHLNINNYN